MLSVASQRRVVKNLKGSDSMKWEIRLTAVITIIAMMALILFAQCTKAEAAELAGEACIPAIEDVIPEPIPEAVPEAVPEPMVEVALAGGSIMVTQAQYDWIVAQLGAIEAAGELKMLAQLIYTEARGVKSTMERAGVPWCVLNRVDNGWKNTIAKVIKQRAQFAYKKRAPVKDQHLALARDVVTRWLLEKMGHAEVGRVLPREYNYFSGRKGHNWFRIKYKQKKKVYWDWSLPNPYAD
jgi:hypothetical protein